MLDKQLAAFLEDGLSIHIATRNADLEPNGARVAAVKVEADGRTSSRTCPRSRPGTCWPISGERAGGAGVSAAPTTIVPARSRACSSDARDAAPGNEQSSCAASGSASATSSSTIGLPRAAARTLDDVARDGHPHARDGALRARRRARARERRCDEPHARVARLVLPGADSRHAVHLLARRHPQRRVSEPRGLRGPARTWRSRSSSSTRAGATSPRTRTALVRVIDPDTGQGWRAAAALRALRDVGPDLRAHGAAHRGHRVVLRAQGDLQAAGGRHLRGAGGRAGRRRVEAAVPATRSCPAARRPTRSSRCGRCRTCPRASSRPTRSNDCSTRFWPASTRSSASRTR